MKTVKAAIDGIEVEGAAVLSRNTLWVHLDGETFTVDVSDASTSPRRGKSGDGESSGTVRAPMPGKIIKIPVAAGDSVTAGQVLLVMEAMKMEYTLKAPAQGTVQTILVASGEQVALGQQLIQLEQARS